MRNLWNKIAESQTEKYWISLIIDSIFSLNQNGLTLSERRSLILVIENAIAMMKTLSPELNDVTSDEFNSVWKTFDPNWKWYDLNEEINKERMNAVQKGINPNATLGLGSRTESPITRRNC